MLTLCIAASPAKRTWSSVVPAESGRPHPYSTPSAISYVAADERSVVSAPSHPIQVCTATRLARGAKWSPRRPALSGAERRPLVVGTLTVMGIMNGAPALAAASIPAGSVGVV